jgi:integrase
MAESSTEESRQQELLISPSTVLVPEIEISLPEEFAPGHPLFEAERASRVYATEANSAATRRAYNSDWRDFVRWCQSKGQQFLPASPDTVRLYITELAQRKQTTKKKNKEGAVARYTSTATITRRLTSIAAAHKRAIPPQPNPADLRNNRLLADTYHGICKSRGKKQEGKEPITLELLRKMVNHCDGTLAASRDRALLLVGFAGGFRRSELAAIKVEDIHEHKRGVTIFVPISKTDQEKQGREVELPFGCQPDTTPLAELICPVRALRQWLKQSGIKTGPVFRKVGHAQHVQTKINDERAQIDSNTIGRIFKRALRRANPTREELQGKKLEDYGAHSLRAGFCTVAYDNGTDELSIMRQTGHTSRETVRKYIRAEQNSRLRAAYNLGM